MRSVSGYVAVSIIDVSDVVMGVGKGLGNTQRKFLIIFERCNKISVDGML